MDEEVFTLREAAAFMKFGERFTRGLIKARKLLASQTSKNGEYRILKSSCIDCIKNMTHNESVGGIDCSNKTEVTKTWQSTSGAKCGTVTSQHQTVVELGARLAQRTKGSPRNTTIL
ncbi:hypothetical protein [Tolumonas lignilytica]|uniref:hypothetical protein n=1 Tax=Tolumonas lignilytica TaxID=1283284 RepID=UPI001F47A048|nr:hypothetical protein [Tolumonas lignilytica]